MRLLGSKARRSLTSCSYLIIVATATSLCLSCPCTRQYCVVMPFQQAGLARTHMNSQRRVIARLGKRTFGDSLLSLHSSQNNYNMNEDVAKDLDPTAPSEIGSKVHEVICSNCNGEGKLVSKRRSRKSKYEYKRAKAAAKQRNIEFVPPPQPVLRYEPCSECAGSGLVKRQVDKTSWNIDSFISNVHVAIIGGGIGGMALALSLQHRNISFTVFERDASFAERKQGYGLTMQQGARALKGLGFDYAKEDSNQFGIQSKKHVVHKSDGTVVGEWGLRVWGRKKAQEANRQNAHISRQELRRLLMRKVNPENIIWNHKLKSYTETYDKVDLKFTTLNGDEVNKTTSLLVGADGIRSVVRRNKIGEEESPLRYLGCVVILGICNIKVRPLTLIDGETVFQTSDGSTRLYVMPFSSAGMSTVGSDEEQDSMDKTMWQLSFPMNEEDSKLLSKNGATALKKEALKRCELWHDPVPKLLSDTPEDLISGYPVYDRDIVDSEMLRGGQSQNTSSRVTLLGDAAHCMSPFKGQGANQALLDALSLSRILYRFILESDNPRHISKALAEYEKEMLERSTPKVKASAEAAKFLHTDVVIKEGNITRGAAARAV